MRPPVLLLFHQVSIGYLPRSQDCRSMRSLTLTGICEHRNTQATTAFTLFLDLQPDGPMGNRNLSHLITSRAYTATYDFGFWLILGFQPNTKRQSPKSTHIQFNCYICVFRIPPKHVYILVAWPYKHFLSSGAQKETF